MATFVRPLVALASAPWHVLFVRLVDRTGKGIRSSPRDALIADSTDAGSIGRAFGFHNAMDHAGAVAGPLVATALLALHVPVRDIFLIAGIPGLCALIAVSTVREAPRSLPPPEAPSPASDSASESAATAARKPAVPLPPPLKQYLAVLLVFALGNSSDAFLLLRARELGVSLGTIPLLWALLHVSKMVWSHFGGAWSDRGSRVRLILAGWLVYSATYLALAYATTSWQVWALFVVYGAFYGLSEPAEKALVRDLAPPRARGAAYGAYNFALGMASLPAGILMGALWSWRGPRVALLTGAALALVAAVALARWERTRVR